MEQHHHHQLRQQQQQQQQLLLSSDSQNNHQQHSNGDRLLSPDSLRSRRSVLSDPRLSQLFQLSSQLEALADSIEIEQQQQQQQNKQQMLKTPNGNQPLFMSSATAVDSTADASDSKQQLYQRQSSAYSDSRMSDSSQGEAAAATSAKAVPSQAYAKTADTADGSADQISRTEEAWQARCMELEWSLQKFRDQAQNIREMLREKVKKTLFL